MTEEQDDKGFTLSRQEAIKFTGWSKATLGRKMKRGLPYISVPGRTKPTPMFRESDLRNRKYIGEYFAQPQVSTPKITITNAIKNVDTESSSDEDLLIDLQIQHRQLNESLADELICTIKSCSSDFFESLVVDLIVAMGYGGSLKDAGRAVGKSNDGGIDGIIKQDRLGLDQIYIQAKRWEHSVGRPEIQKFAGALQGKGAMKGIVLTTSEFSKAAREYVSSIQNKIILIDGKKLVDLMIEYNLGVSVDATYEIKKIDSDYFIEE